MLPLHHEQSVEKDTKEDKGKSMTAIVVSRKACLGSIAANINQAWNLNQVYTLIYISHSVS